MSEKINVQCYKCKTVYELDSEMCGQVVECAVCLAVFVVPKLQHKVEMVTTNPYIENDEFNLKTSSNLNEKLPSTKTTKLPTDTIKINMDKTGRGMIPKIDDKFGACQTRNPLQHDNMEDALKKIEKTQVKSAKSVENPQKEEPKWWHFGKNKK